MTLRYPQDLMESDADYVTFRHFKYRSNANTETEGRAPDRGQAIILYVPNSTPATGVQQDWGTPVDFSGPLGSLIRDAAMVGANAAQSIDPKAIVSSADGARGEANKIVDDIKSKFQGNVGERAGGAVRQGIVKAIGGMTNTSASQLMALTRGQSYNPNVELLYKAPKLRSFTMSYTFVPKNAGENAAVNSIIREFKQWSSPRDLENGMFEVPDLWQITYKTGGTDNVQMNKFKPAACTHVVVVDNPTPNMHVSHPGGAPVERIMTLSFSEVELVLQDDYDGIGVGF